MEYILPQTSRLNSTRCAKETTKDTVSSVNLLKPKATKQLADAQTSKRARPPNSSPKRKSGLFNFQPP